MLLTYCRLDGAANPKARQEPLLEKILARFNIAIQVGGGIRSKELISKLLDQGAARVIIGSFAVSNPVETREWLSYFGTEQFGIAVDVRYGKDLVPMIATNAWQQVSQYSLFDLLDYYQDSNLTHVLCTNVSLDGTLAGPDFDLYLKIAQRFPTLQIQASGGIQSLLDIQQLRQQGLHAAVIGRALYEKRFSLAEVLAC